MAVGLIIVVAAAYLLYFEADLNRWLSMGILSAGILLFVGLAVMMFAGSAPSEPPARTQPASPGPPTTVVQHNRPAVHRNEPR